MSAILFKLALLFMVNLVGFTLLHRRLKQRVRLQMAHTNQGAAVTSTAETSAVKWIGFFIVVMTFEVQILIPKANNLISALIMAVCNSDRSGVTDTQQEVPFVETEIQGNNIVVYAGTRANPNYHMEINGFDTGDYDIESVPGGNEALATMSKNLNDYLSKGVDSSITIDIEIYGQADNIPCRKGSRFNGSDPIHGVQCYSEISHHIVVRDFIPKVTLMRNEDYGRLRAAEVELNLRNRIKYPLCHSHLKSGTTSKIGPKHRKVDIKVTITDALNYKIKQSSKSKIKTAATQD